MQHFDLDTMPSHPSVSGLPIKIISGEHVMMTVVELPAGFANQVHQHPNEQLGYVLAGEMTYEVEGEMFTCGPGEAYLIPASVPHAVHVSSDGPARFIDVFSPPREEYRPHQERSAKDQQQ